MSARVRRGRMLSRLVMVCWGIGLTAPLFAAEPGRLRFNRDIRPLLSDRCFACHGPDEKRREADVHLDTFDGATGKAGSSAVIVPGKPDESLLIERIASHDPDVMMPPPSTKKPPFSAAEVQRIRDWIAQGAEYEGHWAFLPISTEPPPTILNSPATDITAGAGVRVLDGPAASERSSIGHFVRNPIDTFILRKLRTQRLSPSPEASRETLIRRVTLDLTGLLPSPEDVQAFVRDPDPQAYEQLVDRLLASPHYGERWGRHWLDQARYGDSNGYSIDAPREAWPYRDWVIDSLNQDLPFDQFTIEQLAGDLLPDPTKRQLVATGFHRNTLINQEGGTDPEQFRVEAAMDRVSTTGAVWLGLTVGCAQCHSHKFDPISHREYYSLFAFFNSTQDVNNVGPTVEVLRGELFGNAVVIPPDPPGPSEAEMAEWKSAWEAKTIETLSASTKELDEKSKDLLAILKQPTQARSIDQQKFVKERFEKDEPRAKKFAKKPNPDVAKQMVLRELAKPRETFILTRGDFTRPDKDRGPLTPGVIAAVAPSLPTEGTRSRLDLARWLVHPDNPLTARVTVNRVWMRYFGRGLVETEEDFGSQGSPPTHPELLDWLAREFQHAGWSQKHLHRLIVTSGVYRQASHERPDLIELDPRNLLLARQQRIRLDAEVIRDIALSASGLLQPVLGGYSVHPPQPDGVYAFTQVNKVWPTETGRNRHRRTLYTFFFRSAPYPLFTTFDTPDFQSVCTRRARSNTPLQALTLANDAVFLELAQGFAQRLLDEVPGEATSSRTQARLERATQLTLGRPPTDAERELLTTYISHSRAELTDDAAAASALLGKAAEPASHAVEQATWVLVARALFNTDNFITRE